MYADRKSMCRAVCTKLALAVSFVAIICLELLYKKPLVDLTYQVIPAQQDWTICCYLDMIQLIGGGEIGAVIILASVAASNNRARLFYYILNFTLAFTLTNTMRMCYTDPRPFWMDPTMAQNTYGGVIKNKMMWQCNVGYGNPDPHTVISASLATTFLLEQYWSQCMRCCRTLVVLPFVLVYIIVMAYSRVLLGSIDFAQALYGLTLGVWLGFGQFHHRVNLQHRINKMINGGTSGKSSLTGSFILMLTILGIQIGVFYAQPSLSKRQFKQEWLDQINSQCSYMGTTYAMVQKSDNSTMQLNPNYPYTMNSVGNFQSVPLAGLAILQFVAMFAVWLTVKLPKSRCGQMTNCCGRFMQKMNQKYKKPKRCFCRIIGEFWRRMIFVLVVAAPVLAGVYASNFVQPWGYKLLIILLGSFLSVEGLTKFDAICYTLCLLEKWTEEDEQKCKKWGKCKKNQEGYGQQEMTDVSAVMPEETIQPNEKQSNEMV